MKVHAIAVDGQGYWSSTGQFTSLNEADHFKSAEEAEVQAFDVARFANTGSEVSVHTYDVKFKIADTKPLFYASVNPHETKIKSKAHAY